MFVLFDENLKNEDINIDFAAIEVSERGEIARLFDRLERLSPSRGRISFQLIKENDIFVCALEINAQGFHFAKSTVNDGALKSAQEVLEKAFEALNIWKRNRFEQNEV